jgi:hypothetical protein
VDGSLLLPGDGGSTSAGLTLRLLLDAEEGVSLRWGVLSLEYLASSGTTIVANSGTGAAAAFARGEPAASLGKYTTISFSATGTRIFVGTQPWASTPVVTSASGSVSLPLTPNRVTLPANVTLLDLQVYPWAWPSSVVANPRDC